MTIAVEVNYYLDFNVNKMAIVFIFRYYVDFLMLFFHTEFDTKF